MKHLLLIFILLPSILIAQDENNITSPVTKNIDYMSGVEATFNDSIHYPTGAVLIKHKDLVLPGQGGMNIEITRVYQSPNLRYPSDPASDYKNFKHQATGESWQINFGYIYQDKWDTKARALEFMSKSARNVSNLLSSCDISGTTTESPLFRTPDGAEDLILSNGNLSQAYSYHTKSGWRGGCLSSAYNVGNNGFIFYSPDGKKYIYNLLKQVSITKPELANNSLYSCDPSACTNSNAVSALYGYFPSRIEDKNGNWINIEYVSNAERGDIQKITTSDGRIVEFVYSNSGTKNARLVSVKSGLTVVTYEYANSSDNISTVKINDIITWQFKYYPVGDYFANYLSEITNLYGGKILYTYHYSSRGGHYYNLGLARIATRTLSGKVPVSTTSYEFHTVNPPVNSIYEYTLVKESNKCVKYIYERTERPLIDDLNWSAGLISSITLFDNSNCSGNAISNEQYEWKGYAFSPQDIDSSGYYEGYWGFVISNDVGFKLPMLIKKTVIQDGDTYITEFDDFTAYGKPKKITSFTPQNEKVIEWREFSSHENLNGLEVLLKTSKSRGDTDPRLEYQKFVVNNKLQVESEVKFGSSKIFEYHSNGNLKKISYAGTDIYTIYDNYFRGLPQLTTYPARYSSGVVSATQEVNLDGSIASNTDRNLNKTSYKYDALGRTLLVDPDDPLWASTSISYRLAGQGDPLSVAGSYAHELTKGNYQKTIYFDGLGRPILERERDLSNVLKTTRYSRKTYNQENLVDFSSYRSASPDEQGGVIYKYDVLGRLLESQESASQLKTKYEYYAQNRTRTIDPKGKVTDVYYKSYGHPQKNLIKSVSSPENVITVITYNIFDKVVSVSQGGYMTEYNYDESQRLCRIYKPETGSEYFDYNAANLVSWSAKGVAGSAFSCNRGVVSNDAKINYTYDNQGDLWKKISGNQISKIEYTLDPEGNVKLIDSGKSKLDYLYNSLNLVENESLTIDGKVFAISRTYDSLGYQKSLRYPNGFSVNYNVNALGQQVSLGDYISEVTYEPSGLVSSIRNANGVTSFLSLNSRRLPENLYLKNAGSNTIHSLTYGWDSNANIKNIQDNIDPQYSLSMEYDGLNRVVRADGYWGVGSISYDVVGNITNKSMGSHSLNYIYDGLNRLSSINGSKSYQFEYDARGNVINNASRQFMFNRFDQLENSNGINYVYDGNNKRVKKIRQNGSIYTMYGQNGKLYYRLNSNGDHQNYLYLNNQLAITIEGRGVSQ